MMSLRLDRFFGSWGAEFSPDYTPAETGMDRFIAWSKEADFIGRAAAEAERATGPARRLLNFEVDATELNVDARRFQFKTGGDQAGVVLGAAGPGPFGGCGLGRKAELVLADALGKLPAVDLRYGWQWEHSEQDANGVSSVVRPSRRASVSRSSRILFMRSHCRRMRSSGLFWLISWSNCSSSCSMP